jgi:hypothetical protein
LIFNTYSLALHSYHTSRSSCKQELEWIVFNKATLQRFTSQLFCFESDYILCFGWVCLVFLIPRVRGKPMVALISWIDAF